jgi:hypothetical protein
MKVTIDSAEPLADAIRVVGALYNVTLAEVEGVAPDVAPGAGSAVSRQPATPIRQPARRTRTKKTAPGRTPSKRTRAERNGTASPADIRKWAKANGHEISSRGTLPAPIRLAYEEAHRGK